MFGIGFTELLIILGVALIVFGPERLPELAKTLGTFLGQLRRQSDDLKREFYNSIYPPANQLKSSLSEFERELLKPEEPATPALTNEKDKNQPEDSQKEEQA